MPKKLRAVVDRLGVKKIIALCFLAAVFVVLAWISGGKLLGAAFAAVTAYGAASHRYTVKLGGACCLFLSVWAICNISTAFLALLVLSAIDYLAEPKSITCAVGAICFTAVAGAVAGVVCAIICLLLIILAGMAANAQKISDIIVKIIHK
jgi:hypothetical protein